MNRKRSGNSQVDRVIEYMRTHGSITSMDAFEDLRITRLSAVIFRAKRLGYHIATVIETSERSDITFYARYSLEE